MEFLKKYRNGFIALLLFALNFVLKIYSVGENDIALDEPFSIYHAQMDIPSIFKMLATENNPPLHFLLLHFWIKFFGIDAFSVRFLSVLFGSCTVVVIYFIGRKFFSFPVAITSGLIYTLSNFHQYFSHEARVYPIFVLLTALSLYYFLKISHEPDRKRNFIILTIINILLIYSHYFGFFVLATEFLSMFFVKNFKKIYKKIFIVFFVIFISYIPNIIVFFNRMSVSVTHGTWVRKPEITELYGNLNRFLNSRMVMLIILLVLLVNVILLIYNKQLKTKIKEFFSNEPAKIVFVWFLFPYLTMFFVSFWVPMFLDRYIIYISVSFYIIISFVLFHFAYKKLIAWLSAVLVLFGMLYFFDISPDNNRNVKELAQAVKEIKKNDPNSLLIISPEYCFMEFTYHYNISYFKNYNYTIRLLNNENIFPLRDLKGFDNKQFEGKSVYFLDCGCNFAFGKNEIFDELSKAYYVSQTLFFPGIYYLYRFEKNKFGR